MPNLTIYTSMSFTASALPKLSLLFWHHAIIHTHTLFYHTHTHAYYTWNTLTIMASCYFTHTHTHTHTHARTHAHFYHTHTHMHPYTWIIMTIMTSCYRTHTHTHTFLSYTHTYMHTYMYSLIHIHTRILHTCIHTYSQRERDMSKKKRTSTREKNIRHYLHKNFTGDMHVRVQTHTHTHTHIVISAHCMQRGIRVPARAAKQKKRTLHWAQLHANRGREKNHTSSKSWKEHARTRLIQCYKRHDHGGGRPRCTCLAFPVKDVYKCCRNSVPNTGKERNDRESQRSSWWVCTLTPLIAGEFHRRVFESLETVEQRQCPTGGEQWSKDEFDCCRWQWKQLGPWVMAQKRHTCPEGEACATDTVADHPDASNLLHEDGPAKEKRRG